MPRIVPADATLIPKDAVCVFQGVLFDVYQWPQVLFDGSMATFEMLRRPDTVIGICIKDDNILFIEEQQPNRPVKLDLPGGRVDSGEEWEAAVRRECAEELGLQFSSWQLIDVQQPASKIEWFVATYIARHCVAEHETKHDAGERITTKALTFVEAKQAVAANAFMGDYVREVFARANTLEDLYGLPDFKGKQI